MRRFNPKPKHLACLIAAACAQGAFAQSAVNTEDVNVFGQGQVRQVQNISRKDLEQEAPGSSPFKALSKLAGVSFQSSDSFGAYEWSTRLTVRGFGQNYLGFTLDDVPLGDMSYGNMNGLHISRAIASENIGRVALSQGTGAIDTASTSNLGGTVQFYSLDPANTRTVSAAQSFGTDAARRTHLRYDSGKFDNGTKFALSYTDQNSEKWKGSGEQRQQQFNAKVVSIFGENRWSAFLNYSDRKEIDYQDMSKEMISRLGYKWDNYYPNWQAAINSANHIWSRGETSIDDAYYAGSGLRKDWLMGTTLDAKMADDLRWKTTLYHHKNKGAGLWVTPYTASSVAVPIALRTTEYDIDRSGVLTDLTWTAGIHKVNGGLWYESNTFDQARRFYSLANGPLSMYDFPSGAMATSWDYEFKTTTRVFHLQDTLSLSDKLTANFGFKSPYVESKSSTKVGSTFGTIKSEKNFLPQAGVNFKLTETDELFASAAQNMRAFQAAATGTSPFATTAAGFTAINGSLKPETSVTLEGGWRHRADNLETLLTVYHVDFKDRLLAIQQGSGIVGNPSVLANVGKVETNGMEASLSWNPARNFTWVNSLSLNDSKYKNDVTSNNVTYAVSGKQVVDSPKTMVKSELGYDNGSLFGHIGATYLGKRYYTYTNDNSVDGYTLWNLAAGYRFGNVGMAKDMTLNFTVNNLLDKKYISSIGTNGFVFNDPTGTNQTILPGAPRSAYLTLSGKF
ncbi:MAG TPA: TonB-dependent receptor [Rhodocyclaceae bacterium]|nr:TonB-dependent receptor [Rhodocyclaceae bacterium]